ncbi:LOW QUALITY PROTEIN: WAT1-related protein At3g30340-like [Dioscorea cayenensis subsp. rotundata]|uniref:WAT1-related protein n=1 Tax=Dioscorea cayennensis subsp. rotundata TaxID=55577 RepID=A0AB40C4P8_DIOCR|nr:LOW QUALITY PROTEIN: WAT1-related protein At3g30340-like [Dioscorea cayenensis subsp. rotundata]
MICLISAMNTMIKKVIDEGMNKLVLITFRQLIATLVLTPIAYFSERKSRPKMTTQIFVYLFFSALFGASLTQYLFFLGMEYTSATFACAFLNTTPALTFLIAVGFRLETLNLKSKTGIAKMLGTFMCVTGAMLMTFYKGTTLNKTSHIPVPVHHHQPTTIHEHSSEKWMLGSMALIAGSISWSSWFVVQTRLGHKYPALYSCTAIIFFISFLQAATLSIVTERHFSIWALTNKYEIFVVLFAGLIGSGFGFLAMSWCVQKRGPVFTTAFSPLIQIIVAGVDFCVLHGPLYLGSVLGSGLVIVGLYFLLWGKSNEAQCPPVKQTQELGEAQTIV